MNKLFAVYMWGKAKGCNIELHDVQFVIWETIEACHTTLKEKRFGIKDSAHIDCYMHLRYVDGYAIELYQWEKTQQDQHLYFINAWA